MAVQDKILLIEDRKSKLKWQAIKQCLLAEIESGKYSPGDALPSESILCKRWGTARNTVRQALEEIERDGYIYRVRGRGTFLSNMSNTGNVAGNRLTAFAVMVPEIRRSLYPCLIQGFNDRLLKSNCHTLVCQTNYDIERQGNAIFQLLHCGVHGLALVPPTKGKTPAFHIETLKDNKIPVVACHRPIEGIKVPVITWDKKEVGRMAGSLLLEKGHKKISYYGVAKYSTTEAHVEGLKSVLAQAGVAFSDKHVLWNQNEQQELEDFKARQLTELIKSKDRPTAIVCSDDDEAEKLYWVISELGLKIPEDISIVAFGNSHRNGVLQKFFTSIIVDEKKLGSMAAQLLYEMHTGQRSLSNSEEIVLKLGVSTGKSVL